jgi:hypothetical protein
MVLEQRDRVDISMLDWERYQDTIQVARDKFADQRGGLRFAHVQPQREIGPLQARQQPREQVGRERGNDSEL